jgi:SH3-like domain-containing protein
VHARLRSGYRPQYPDPICFAAGESLVLGGRDTEWPQFVWATDARGRSGWVHESRLDGAVAVRDYDARELAADAGARVQLLEEAGGWWWSRDARGECGWLPARELDIETE